ncbi:FAM183A and FAM183B related-domain-containing protein [Fimicolochytrium jonesii]|uniref:FAM183A and FAM183B related-domain-containing protein n=1 Tax=Fimicolochytrium jonesii TaxID=1396493 RepID=UPI0022FDF447|nr:FAM183A and FAM183B related-domain-containing protein [Fimicolochytrium jonesii]KAI8816300.1 FAM183A and FAM183B related-domain-containing protein [Fimicolochytrium jonesii]
MPAAVAGGAPGVIEPVNEVFKSAIHAETVRKEMQRYSVYESFLLTPTVEKGLVVAEKPNRINIQDIEKDVANKPLDLSNMRQSSNAPRPPLPVTTSQNYGWNTTALLRNTDRRFYHPKVETEITKMYGAAISSTARKDKKSEAK